MHGKVPPLPYSPPNEKLTGSGQIVRYIKNGLEGA